MMPSISNRFRLTCLTLLFALLIAALPVHAAGPDPNIHMVLYVSSVQADTSVTLLARNVPMRAKFNITMGNAMQRPFEGIEVTKDWDSATGGEIEINLSIPEALKGKYIISIKMNSRDGYAAETFFFNRTQSNPVPSATPSAHSTQLPMPEITFSGVKKGVSAIVEGKNFPAETTIYVRVGPYDTFLRDYEPLPTVRTGADGTLAFTIDLPKKSQAAENIRVRLDYGRQSATAIFHNVDGGSTVLEKDLVKYIPCQVLEVNPIPSLQPGQEFDVVWKLKNSGSRTWLVNTVDYHYVSGTKMQKYGERFDINGPVLRGSIFRVTVDMVAPQQPGWYSTTWALSQDALTLCTFSVTVAVVSPVETTPANDLDH